MTLDQWEMNYDGSIYWIIQPDHMRQSRWFWKDTVTVQQKPVQYVAPRLKREVDVPLSLYAYCTPYTKLSLPDTYSLFTKEGDSLGLASISTLRMSSTMREKFSRNDKEKENGIVVEVIWNDAFRKYQIFQIMPHDTPLTASSFFHHSKSSLSC
jgi:hypothetical protein